MVTSQASPYSAMSVTTDMTKGIIDRFRCMSISKSAVLIGHTGAGVIRGAISNTIIILTALIPEFRPQAGFVDWLLVISLLLLINITITRITVLCGIISKSVDGAIEMLSALQPMTTMIDSLRALVPDLPLGNSLWLALAWCIGLSVASFIVSVQMYNRRLS